MKEVNEEELYPLSGWDSIEENLSYSDIFFIKKLQQHIQKTVNSKLPPSPNPLNRTQLRKKSKEYYSSKISSGHLKRDKQYLQKYIKREQACLNRTDSTYFQEPSPNECLNFQEQIFNTNNEKRHHHKTTEISISATKSPEEESSFVQKCILFSGIKKQKSKKRRFIPKNNSKEASQKLIPKEFTISSQKTFQQKITEKLNLQKIDQIDFDRQDFYITPKKRIKFPLFFRQLNSNQQLRKDKYKSAVKLRKKIDVNFPQQFTDDNIFQTRFIRA